ncbi:MAG: hypothetical protein HYW34_00425 [Candidatus Brennerbacteria bacterium]|nr:hypothetical protein [Candidatus Brennerbacteria bacterium]
MTNQLKLDPVKKLFKESFEFYLNRFWRLTAISLTPIIALILLSAPFIVIYFLGINVFTGVGILAVILFFIFFFVFEFWALLALIYSIKEDAGIFLSFQETRRLFFPFLKITILINLIILGGFMMGIVPGIIFSFWFVFVSFLLIDQGLTGMNAILRSKEYVKGYWWAIVGRNLILLMFAILVSVSAYLVISSIINDAVGELARSIVYLILAPFMIVFMFFLYRNFVNLKPELAGAPVSGKKGFFIFSAILGVLAMLLILLITLIANRLSSMLIESENEVANWAVYHNTKYNYSFRYPRNFTIYTAIDQAKNEVILPTNTSDKVYLTDKKDKLFCCEPFITSISVVNGFIDIKNWRQYAEIPDYRIKSQNEIVFDGYKAFEVRSSVGIDSVGARLILIPRNQFSFKLIQGDEGEPWESITNSFFFYD